MGVSGSSGPFVTAAKGETSMAWKLMYLEALDAPRKGEAAREAERRAMYARPDALPLPEEAPKASRLSSVASALRPRLPFLRRRSLASRG